MLALFDIGNTAITYGLYGGGRFKVVGSALIGDIPKIIQKWSKSGWLSKYDKVVISSVVPQKTAILEKSFKRIKGLRVYVLGRNLKVPLKHNYKNYKKLGQDRIVNLYGAARIYKLPVVVFDYGTAVKADYLDKKGVFQGGMIIPGPEVSFQALIERAALLPKKERLPKKAGAFLGRSTEECLSTGILQGYGAMTDGLIARFKAFYGKDLRVIATGGFAEHLKPYVKSFDVYDPMHSLKSLLVLAKDRL